MKKAALILFTLSVIFSCNNLSSSKEDLKPEDFNQIDTDGVFKLSIPKYMKVMNNLNEEASLQYANVFKEVYTVVIYEDKDEFVTLFKQIDQYNDDLSVLENYSESLISFFKEAAVVDRIEPYGTTTINGLNAKQVKIFAKIDNIDIAYVISFIEGKENVYQVMNWTLPNRIDKYEDTFMKISNSFELLK